MNRKFVQGKRVQLEVSATAEVWLWRKPRAAYLQQEVGGIVDAHHQASYSHHVVDVGEANEADCSQVVDEHDEEVLPGRETGTLTP